MPTRGEELVFLKQRQTLLSLLLSLDATGAVKLSLELRVAGAAIGELGRVRLWLLRPGPAGVDDGVRVARGGFVLLQD